MYDREKDVVIHTPEQVEAMRLYAEQGFTGTYRPYFTLLPLRFFFFAGLIFDHEHNGLQLPLHIAALARIPFTAANVGLAGTYFDLSQVWSARMI